MWQILTNLERHHQTKIAIMKYDSIKLGEYMIPFSSEYFLFLSTI
jgi:hypothetical protein